MAVGFRRILSSRPFRFLIGKDKILFTLHADALAEQSGPLLALVNGDMIEAREGCAWLEDTDAETFFRVGEYLYTGDYTPMEPAILLDHSQIAQETVSSHAELDVEDSRVTDCPTSIAAEVTETVDKPIPVETVPLHDSWDFYHATKKDKRKSKRPSPVDTNSWAVHREPESLEAKVSGSKKSLLWNDFINRTDSTDTRGRSFRPRQNTEPCEDYGEVFLCHARLYVFADKYEIEPLKTLSLYKLRRTLASFTLFEERLRDIVELLQYGYDNTPERIGTKDGLRASIIQYVACVVETMAGSEDFRLLLGEANAISYDLITELLRRLD